MKEFDGNYLGNCVLKPHENRHISVAIPILIILCVTYRPANGTTVDYRYDLPEYAPSGFQSLEVTTLSLGGITVTGSNTLFFDENNGLSVVGGVSLYSIDTNESVTFGFEDGLAKDVSFFDGTGYDGDEIVSAYGENGVDLGSVSLGPYSVGLIDVSALFGGAAISEFTFTSNNSYGRIWYVEYSTVPIPAALWLFGSGLLGLIGISRRKRLN